mmetsp:Transcript_10569/g.43705  ORF Transcript_10569/g.43705 Transcript_10569/m.43705 type:complete len:481 (-) Transcript_10569:20-1462(-)
MLGRGVSHCRGAQGRGGALPPHGDGGHRGGRQGAWRGRPGRAHGGAAGGRYAVRLPGAGGRGHARDAGRLRRGGQRAGQAHQGLSAADRRRDQVAPQQQERGRASAGVGPHRPHRARDGRLRRGAADGAPGRGDLRKPGRGVPRGAGFAPRRAQGHRQRHRHVAHDAAHQGPPAAPDAHPQEPPREGAGGVHQPGGAHRRPRRRVRARARVDAHLLRPARHAPRAQEGHPPRHREHLRVHRQGHRPAGRAGHAAQQSQGAGAPEPRVHHRGHRHRGRDVLALHRPARAAQRVPHARDKCAERRAQVPELPLRVRGRDGQGLHLRRHAAAGGCAHRPRPRAPPDGRRHRAAHGARRAGPGLRGRAHTPAQPHMAQHLRDEPAPHQRHDGRHRRPARVARPTAHSVLHARGALPPGAPRARDVLEGVQQPVRGQRGRARGLLPRDGRRRGDGQHVQAPRARHVHLRSGVYCWARRRRGPAVT